MSLDDLSQYDYELPKQRIAHHPLSQRDASRLLVLDRATRQITHGCIQDLPDVLNPGDCLVLNDSRVIPARLAGVRTATGAKWDGLFAGTASSGAWRLLGRTRGKLRVGEELTLFPLSAGNSDQRLQLALIARDGDRAWLAQPNDPRDSLTLLNQFGTVPLPPYISRPLPTALDWERYQTSFARKPGSVAAPTAGLHFTPELLDACLQQGIRHTFVTLHVGLGTFLPITETNIDKHQMHGEWFEINQEAIDTIQQTQRQGGRIIAVGTTSVRSLETASAKGTLQALNRETDLFIRPGFQFRCVDGLLTNFHLPRSTLFLLACAFAGTQLLKAAYEDAIRKHYRFYSYGDATLIL